MVRRLSATRQTKIALIPDIAARERSDRFGARRREACPRCE